MDVNYHVTEYKHMIDSLNLQVKTLQRELKRQHLSHDPEVTQLCEQLKTCSQEEKEIRYSTISALHFTRCCCTIMIIVWITHSVVLKAYMFSSQLSLDQILKTPWFPQKRLQNIDIGYY